MPSNKDRLYVALYNRAGPPKMPTLEDTYHWALAIGPKVETSKSEGWRIHAKNVPAADSNGNVRIHWTFEERQSSLGATNAILARVCIGKIEDTGRARGLLRNVPVYDDVEGWNCVSWVMSALAALQQDQSAMGTSKLDWQTVKDAAMAYVEQKKVQGRWNAGGGFDTSKVATFDLLQGRETIA